MTGKEKEVLELSLVSACGMTDINARELGNLLPELHRVLSQMDMNELSMLGRLTLEKICTLYGEAVGLRTEFKVEKGTLVV